MTRPSPIRTVDRRGAAALLGAGTGPWGFILAPLSLLYGLAAALHRGIYSSGMRKRRSLPRAVVSVGNIAVGGGGKTPLVMWLAVSLEGKGLKVAVLSRGYGRTGSLPERVPKSGWTDQAFHRFGDEPLCLAAALPTSRVYVGADRWSAGLLALSEGEVDVFVLDDGFSHHSLERDYDLVAVDDRRRFGNGRLLPWGHLREPLWRLREADTVVVTKSARPDPGFDQTLRALSPVPVAWSGYRPRGISKVGEGVFRTPGDFADRRFLVFSGIADPASFEETVEGLELATVGAVRFPDHHPYGGDDLRQLGETARAMGANALLTTEKDATRWPGGGSSPPCFVLGMELFFHTGGKELVDNIVDLVRRRG